MIVDKGIDFHHKRKITTQIRRLLAKNKIPNDIIIQSASTVEKRKHDVGYLTYYVLKEGVKVL